MASRAGNCTPFESDFVEMLFPSLDKGFLINETGGRFSRYDCYVHCLQNCSCLAYAPAHVDGTGCEIWNTNPTNETLSFHRYITSSHRYTTSSHRYRSVYIRPKGT